MSTPESLARGKTQRISTSLLRPHAGMALRVRSFLGAELVP